MYAFDNCCQFVRKYKETLDLTGICLHTKHKSKDQARRIFSLNQGNYELEGKGFQFIINGNSAMELELPRKIPNHI